MTFNSATPHHNHEQLGVIHSCLQHFNDFVANACSNQHTNYLFAILNVDIMQEKPKSSYAEEFLGVRNKDGKKEYYSVFGQYILTPEVFAQLHEDIMQREIDGDHVSEIELTSALEAVRQRSGMMGVRLKGRMYDMGNPTALRRCVEEYSK